MNDLWIYLIAGVAPIGAISFFTIGSKVLKNKKNLKVTIELNEEEMAHMVMWAQRSGLTIKDYVKKIAVTSLPPPAMTEATEKAQRAQALDLAFGALDSLDSLPAPGVMSLPPTRRPTAGGITEENRTHALQRVEKAPNFSLPVVQVSKHPCLHLGPASSQMKGQSQGTCNHREQRGRTCFWSPATASGCMMYEDRARNR